MRTLPAFTRAWWPALECSQSRILPGDFENAGNQDFKEASRKDLVPSSGVILELIRSIQKKIFEIKKDCRLEVGFKETAYFAETKPWH
jgi:hypothetical protein